MWTSILKRILNISKAQAHSALDTIEDPRANDAIGGS